jgi:hypothetical protein
VDAREAIYRIEIFQRWDFSDDMERSVDHRNLEI